MGDSNLNNDLDLDEQQDIARSSYADMLHDDERNHAYYVAIRTVVNYLVRSKEQNPEGDRHFVCCDIGAGSGLLSMMVARSFLDLNYSNFHVTAYECFEPMSQTAKSVIESNHLSDYIDIQFEQVGIDGKPIPNPQYDLLVAELLDTELIGEGCLAVYRFVIENLCSPQCIFIPREARIYIEPISSKGLFRRQTFRDQTIHLDSKQEINIEFDKGVKICAGLCELDDMQTSYLENSFGFERITEPKIAFEFKFDDIRDLRLSNEKKIHFKTRSELQHEIVVHMWWDIIMYDGTLFVEYGPQDDDDKKYSFNKLSNAPVWLRGKYQRDRDEMISKLYNRDIWREHWMQAIYYLPCHEANRSLCGKRAEQVEFDIYAYHDTHSLWFDLTPSRNNRPPDSCTCGVHRRLNRYEISFLNGSGVLQDFIKAKAQMNLSNRHQNLKGRLKIVDSSQSDIRWRLDFWFRNDSEFSVDPAFSIIDYSLMDDICWRVLLNRFMDGDDISPVASFKIVINQVAFHALNRVRMRVGPCQGFDLSESDRMIERTADRVDSSVEAHHLWEYGCDILSPDIVVFDSEQQAKSRSKETSREIIFGERFQLPVPLESKSIEKLRAEWALVFSCNMKLTNGKIIKTGHVVGEAQRTWRHHFKQVVHFLHNHPILYSESTLSECQKPMIELGISLTRTGMSVLRF